MTNDVSSCTILYYGETIRSKVKSEEAYTGTQSKEKLSGSLLKYRSCEERTFMVLILYLCVQRFIDNVV